MKITSILLFILLLSNAVISSAEEADPRVGKAVFNVYPVNIHDQPEFQGMIVEEAIIGTNFIVLSVENGWYKVKTIRGAIGYAAIDWVTEDIKVIEEKKAEEAKQIAQEEKKKKERSLEEEKKKKERSLEEEKQKKERSLDLKKKYPSWSVKDRQLILQYNVRIGMNMEQCRESWGEPAYVSNTTFSSGTHSQWCYDDYCSSALYFDNGVLTAIQN